MWRVPVPKSAALAASTDYIKKNSKLQIVGPFYSQSQMATALNQTTDVLAANADLKGIFGANEPTAIGMGRAIKQAGKAGKIVAIGFDGNQDLQEFVKDGTLEATIVQGSYQMGEKGVDTLLKLLNKEKVEKVIDTASWLSPRATSTSRKPRTFSTETARRAGLAPRVSRGFVK